MSAESPRGPGLAHDLAAVLVRRPVTILMLFLTLLGTGVMAYMKIPLTLLPRGLSSSSLTISLPYPGAGPKEVEDQLTRPVEDELRTIPGVSDVEDNVPLGPRELRVRLDESPDA